MTTIPPEFTVTLRVTDLAAEQIREFMTAEDVSPEQGGLRVSVLPGGCSGFKYSLHVEDEPEAEDLVVEVNGVRCFVDTFSAQYLQGITIGYRSTMQESGFTFENPNATGGCGCGSSFSA